MNTKVKARVFLVACILLALPFAVAQASGQDNIFNQDPFGDGGDGAGGTCAVQCSDGSWSGIACNPGEQAHCTCTGRPVKANPSCS